MLLVISSSVCWRNCLAIMIKGTLTRDLRNNLSYVDAPGDLLFGVLEELLGYHDASIVEQDVHISHLHSVMV